MNKKRNFVWLGEWTDLTADFTPEQLGNLLRMVQQHVDGNEPKPTKDKEVAMAYRFIAGGVDRSIDKYNDICKKREDAARKRWEMQNNANANNSMQMDASVPNSNPNPNSSPNPIPNPNPNSNPIPHKGGESNAPARMGVEYFGIFNNVELLPSERRTLIEQYGETLVNETIESLSCKLMDGNAQSLNHYATLQSWLRHSYKKDIDDDRTPHYTPVIYDN